MGNIIILIFLFVFIFITSLTSIRIVRQANVGVVERLGKFHKKAEVGINILFPFIDHMKVVIDLRERVVDFKPQPVITKDNVTMQIDTVVYYQITDPINYIYEIANPTAAIENLTATTLRNIIGDMDLDDSLTSRDVVNTKLRVILDEATDKWGIKVNRVELKNIIPPNDIQEAMEKQMRAERERRESVLRAEGKKRAAVLNAEGDKQATILNAEANKEANVKKAEGDKESRILRAEGEAEAIKAIKQAESEGIKMVLTAIKESNVDENMLTLKSIEALEKMAHSESSKLIIPSEAIGVLGSLTAMKEVLIDGKKNILEKK